LVRYNAIEAYGEAGVEQARCAAGRIDSPFVGSWVHSVVDELDFVSPYHAVLNALCLQLSVAVSPIRDFLRSPYDYDASLCVGSSVTAADSFDSCIDASTVEAQRVAIKKQCNVSFHNKIEVCLAGDTATMKFCTSHEALQTYPGKPWSLYGSSEALRYDASSPSQPSKWRLLDDWIEQTSLPQVLEDGVVDPFQDDDGTPLLIIDEWERLRRILEEEVVSQDGEVQLSMHGLLWVDIGCRFATARPDIASVRNAVLIAWEDYLRGNLVGHLHIVIAQERQQVGELQLVVEMRPPLAEPPGGGTPILRRITWHYLEGEPQVLAAYQTSGMSLFAFLAQAGLSQLCLAPESNQCNLHIEGRIQLPLLPVILQPGSLVEIFLHGPDIDDNSYDESTLMQQPKPSRSPDLIPLRLLGLNYLNVLFYANQEEALMTQLRRSWPLPGNPVNLEAVHFVACPPTTLSSNQEHVYLLQQREDRFFQAHTNDVLILVTISFKLRLIVQGFRRPGLFGDRGVQPGPNFWTSFVWAGSVTNLLPSAGRISITTHG